MSSLAPPAGKDHPGIWWALHLHHVRLPHQWWLLPRCQSVPQAEIGTGANAVPERRWRRLLPVSRWVHSRLAAWISRRRPSTLTDFPRRLSAAIPVEAVKQNPNLALLITCHGGHIGFLEGLWPRQSTYMDRVFKQFAKAVFEQGGRLQNLSWEETGTKEASSFFPPSSSTLFILPSIPLAFHPVWLLISLDILPFLHLFFFTSAYIFSIHSLLIVCSSPSLLWLVLKSLSTVQLVLLPWSKKTMFFLSFYLTFYCIWHSVIYLITANLSLYVTTPLSRAKVFDLWLIFSVAFPGDKIPR